MDRASRAVVEVARTVLSELDLDVVLDRVVESARQLTGARYAAVGVLNERKTELARFVTVGIDHATRAQIGPLPRGHGVLGEVIRHPEPLRLLDVGSHPRSYGFPAGHPPMHSFLGVPVLIQGEPFGNLYLTEKRDGEFSEADEQAALILAELAGIAIDHARRYGGSEERRAELERTVAALAVSNEIARALGGATDLGVILELVAKRGRALVSARALIIELTRGSDLVVAAAAGELPRGLRGERVALSEAISRFALKTGQAQRISDEMNRIRFSQQGLGRLGVEAQSGLAVPLVFQGHTHGVLLALDRLDSGPEFTPEDERLLAAFAVSAAAAVATAHSVTADRSRELLAAAEEERHRWARELHDETLQSLGALQFSLSAARQTGRPEALEQAVDAAIELVSTETMNLRSLITDLRPAALDELGLGPAIEALAAKVAGTGLRVHTELELGDPHARHHGRRLPPEVETTVYRLAQEALSNAAKHAEAERAVIAVRMDETTLHLSVCDDGRGFDPGRHTPGFGLSGMRERAQLMGGHLQIETAPGKGTTVRAAIPTQQHPMPQSLATEAEHQSRVSGA